MSAIHTVRDGDTLWGIARQHGVPPATLMTLNPDIEHPDCIYPGQQVRLPENRERLSDSRAPGDVCHPAPCEVAVEQITLLPLRYALVEPEAIAGARIRAPYPPLGTRPIGVRLAREGYLYVIEQPRAPGEQPLRLYEFRLQAMTLTRLLDGVEGVTEDRREKAQGAPHLTFGSAARLQAAYATAQWSAARCNRMLENPGERNRRMQSVDLARAAAGFDGDDPTSVEPLLASDRIRPAVAELHEPPASGTPESPMEAERNPYPWTAPPPPPPEAKAAESGGGGGSDTDGAAFPAGPPPAPFERTTLDDLLGHWAPEGVPDERLYGLILRDDLGLLQELADYQDHVVGWLDSWAREHETRYVAGGFIESLFLLDEEGFVDDPRFRALREETSEAQQRAILDYLNSLEHESGGFLASTRRAFGSGEGLLEAINPFAEPAHRRVAQARQQMMDTLGPELRERHQHLIDEQRDALRARLQGAGLGSRGLLELVERDAMGDFLDTHRAHLRRWHALLDRITEDRVRLVETNHFHEAAWYFDPALDDQLQQALYTEYACLRDICRTDEAAESIADWLDAHPQWNEPLFHTLHPGDQRRAARELEELAQVTYVTAGTLQAPETVESFHQLALRLQAIRETYALPAARELGQTAMGLDELRRATFRPARELRFAQALDETLQRFQAGGNLDLDDILRRVPGAAWLDMVRGFAEHGASVELPTERHVRRFNADVDQALALREALRGANRRLKDEGVRRRRGVIDARVYRETRRDMQQYRERIRGQLLYVERRLAGAINPLKGTDNRVGLQLRGLDADTHREIRRMADDARAGRPLQTRADAGRVLRSDGLSVVIAVLQLRNLGSAYVEFRDKEQRGLRDLLAVLGGLVNAAAPTFAAAQGIGISLLAVQLPRVRSQMARGAVAARLGWLTGHLGTGAYGLGFLASLSETGRSLHRWGDALQRGDGQALAAATLTLAGSGGLTATQGWGFWRNTTLVVSAYQEGGLSAAAWATRSARFVAIFVRVNLLGLLFTPVYLGGLWWYRRNQRDALATWLEQSAWGVADAGLDLETHRRRWVNALVEPRLTLRRVDGQAELELVIPDLAPEDLAAGAARLAALRKAPDQWWAPWSQSLAEQLEASPDAPTTLRLPLFPEELNAQTGLSLRLTYPSALVPGLEREVHFHLDTLNPDPVPTFFQALSGGREDGSAERPIQPLSGRAWTTGSPPTVPLQPGKKP
ncbi:toxin VasX [Alkalilimnicola ehrlichii MLHE-1]|uniref:Peptidoglycan-binding LysM n=1 Tax=Alkalilimnicola ehrlichii (strain ATCC BAA-1101 / DSM 17681 / MLHE-1) TaxID=187272 RepID=Q0AAY5_ALKEH|nr:toxin VasX [Alkalilimnicola ehrlichii]ABI56002.1 Peptidoglycan-binding LysM [Alkalilimnicola ehrlichii MLHE-1]